MMVYEFSLHLTSLRIPFVRSAEISESTEFSGDDYLPCMLVVKVVQISTNGVPVLFFQEVEAAHLEF